MEAAIAHERGLTRFRAWLMVTDAMVVLWSVTGAHVLRFGIDRSHGLGQGTTLFESQAVLFSLLLVVGWVLALRLHGAYQVRQFGHGGDEYRVITTATLRIFAGVAMVSYAFQLQIARGYILIALPLGLLGLLVCRYLWRRWLAKRRQTGVLCRDVLVVGARDHLEHLLGALRRAPDAGYRPVAACTSGPGGTIEGVPVIGTELEAGVLAKRHRPDVVICASSPHLGPGALRSLGWILEGSGIELAVVPGLTDVAGPRVATRPVAGLPLVHVEAPVFSGPKLAIKTGIDIVGSTLLILLASPLLLTVAFLVWLYDRGPAFFLQERVGINGEPFQMVKFRSMVVDAEARLEETKASVLDHEDGLDRSVLFKAEQDPRITPVGRVIRKYSIDELPQLFNVLRGQMSLVGPRPPLPREVALYGGDVRRRLLVKPGMTGLWQINGRSDLPWEEAVRFDLYYVENWSVLGDLQILWRTVKAVFTARGAY